MADEVSPVIALQACYTYYYLTKKLKFKVRNPVILFNLVLQNKDKISDIEHFQDPEEICGKIFKRSSNIEIYTSEERLKLTSNAINLAEWVRAL